MRCCLIQKGVIEMAYIEMVNSCKTYHMGGSTIYANRNVSFSVEKGELAIILGSSVGFINSTEIISCVNQGQSTAGSAELNSYGVVPEDAFGCDYYMIARMTFQDTKGLDPYSDEYIDMIQEHKSQLEDILVNQPEEKLKSVKGEYQNKIDEGRQKISDAENELESQKTDGEAKISEAEKTLSEKKQEYQEKTFQV